MKLKTPYWMSILPIAAALIGSAVGGPAAGSAAVDDVPPPRYITPLLAAASDVERRAELVATLGRNVEIACGTLSRYAGEEDATVREHAVRAMDEAGCASIDYYRPYMRDRHAWVIDSLVRAFERHRVGEAVPFLLNRLRDPRKIVTGQGAWIIGERAHRALRAVSCQSLHYDPGGPAEARAKAIAAWGAWYAAHRDASREEWIRAGLEQARIYLASDRKALRLEGLQLLLLIGSAGRPVLRHALRRDPGDLLSTLICQPSAVPRITAQVSCTLSVANSSGHRLSLLPGSVQVELRKAPAGDGDDPGDVGGLGRAAAVDRRGDSDAAQAPTPLSDGDQFELIDRVVDLGPGQRFQRRIRVGPVSSAGRYLIRANLVDLAPGLDPAGEGAGALPPPLEADAILRFEP